MPDSCTSPSRRRILLWDRVERISGYRAGFAIFTVTVALDCVLAKTIAPSFVGHGTAGRDVADMPRPSTSSVQPLFAHAGLVSWY